MSRLQTRLVSHDAQDDDTLYLALSSAERVGMMWSLTIDAWTFAVAGDASGQMQPFDAESRLPRHIVSLYRREG